jgi:MFS family permease
MRQRAAARRAAALRRLLRRLQQLDDPTRETIASPPEAATEQERCMGHDSRGRLSVMMFLEFFIWGAWFPLIFGYLPSLGFDKDYFLGISQQSWILNAFTIGSFTAMFFSAQFADRHFAAERFLAVSQLIGGIAILLLVWARGFWPFFLLMLVHSLFYVPTISITNSIAFANLKDPQHEFPRVRLWGTIGWIAASWPFVFVLADWTQIPDFGSVPFTTWLGKALGTSKTGLAAQEATRYTFLAAGLASLLQAALSLSLPHTPPKKAGAGVEKFAWLEAMKLLGIPYVLILFVVTFLDANVHQCFFIWTNNFLQHVGVPANWVMPVMSIGQVAEIGTMAFLGAVLAKLGWRKTMVIGILGHAVRFAVFALLPIPALVIAINVLHGICYAFFFATVYIFVDEFFPKDARSSAQGLFNFLILGLGPFTANILWPYLGNEVFREAGAVNFQKLFLSVSALGFAAALFLFLAFRPPVRKEPAPAVEAAA